jgi:hypothetical protein
MNNKAISQAMKVTNIYCIIKDYLTVNMFIFYNRILLFVNMIDTTTGTQRHRHHVN